MFGSPGNYTNTMGVLSPAAYNTIDDGSPKAYMVWTLFDSEFNLVKSSSGMLRVPDAPNKTGSFLSLSDLTGTVIFKKFMVSKEEEMDLNGR
ncbi:MAG: hypothetical protein ACOH2V_14120 [Candidatus Saccharimonadaceae bacterium]